MARPLNVLFLLEDLCYGGTQKQNLALAKGLDRSRFNPRILTLTGPTDLDGEVEGQLPLDHLGKGRGVEPFFFSRLGAKLRELEPDILLPCTALPNIWGRIWGWLLRVPLIVGTCRGGGAPVRQHERLLWRLAANIVCNSPALVGAMRKKGAPARHLTYIPNGVDCEHFKPPDRPVKCSPSLLLCVARLARDKDHPTLLRAFAKLAAVNPGLRLRLVGEGPEEAKLRSLVASLPDNIGTRVEFAGACSDPAHHYQEADLFVLSSVREGQPNAILEAMSSGLPVCATSTGGIPGLIREGQGGYLSPPGDAEALCANLERLLADDASRYSFGAHNRILAESSFSFSNMISAHEDLFERLWRERSNRGLPRHCRLP